MSYKPRSGTLRRLKAPLPIYKEWKIPKKDLKGVHEYTRKISKEEGREDNGKTIYLKRESHSNNSDQHEIRNLVLPQAEFSLVSVDLYKSVYRDDNSMPPFPVKHCPGPCIGSSDDEANDDGEYDLDSDDEEWLNANKAYHITPSRLEFIFSLLNKRDTHVPAKAIGALPEAVHSEFPHVFPYWKKKRMQNTNISNLRPKAWNETQSSGYVSTNPHVIFVGKVRKIVQSQPPLTALQKVEKIAEMKEVYNKQVELREKLCNLRLWSKETVQNGLAQRNQVKKDLDMFAETASALLKNGPITGKENQQEGYLKNSGRRTRTPDGSSFSFGSKSPKRRTSGSCEQSLVTNVLVGTNNQMESKAMLKNLRAPPVYVNEFRIDKKRRKVTKIPAFNQVFNGKYKPESEKQRGKVNWEVQPWISSRNRKVEREP